MAESGFTLNVRDGLAVITLTRPDFKNAINGELYIQLTKTLNSLSARHDVSITAITGAGDYYSSGNDLKAAFQKWTQHENIEQAVNESVESVRLFVKAFIEHKKVLVAVVNGPAIGIAATTLPLCDIVYCTPNAWFLTPFTRLGITAEGASSYTFPLIFGTSKANDLLLFGEKLSAEEAAKHGFVSKIVKHENLDKDVWAVLRENALQLSQQSLEESKGLIKFFSKEALNKANDVECAKLKEMFKSEKAQEAAIKFLTRPRRSRL